MSDALYNKLIQQWEEVVDLPPQTLGPLTGPYKAFTKRLKVMPWPLLVFVSLLLVVGLWVIFGSTITFLVTLLQRGF